jgi:hypothetical protein
VPAPKDVEVSKQRSFGAFFICVLLFFNNLYMEVSMIGNNNETEMGELKPGVKTEKTPCGEKDVDLMEKIIESRKNLYGNEGSQKKEGN